MSKQTPTVVEREPVAVRYVEVADEIEQIRMAWPNLEEVVGSLRGRKFIAAFDPLHGWYRACVYATDDVSQAELNLPEFVIARGRYLRCRLRGAPPSLYDEIAPTYASLESVAQRDNARPSLEFYRRHEAVDVLMPVL